MTINFPNNPILNQEYITTDNKRYVYDGVKWVFDIRSSSEKCHTGAVAPIDPSSGDLWWNSENGTLYVYYDDGNSQQWVISILSSSVGGVPDQTGEPGMYLISDSTGVHWGWATSLGIVAPTVTVTGTEVSGVTGYRSDQTITVTTSAFSWNEGEDVHAATDWRIVRDSDGATVWESMDDVVNLTSIDIPAGSLSSVSTAWVRHRGENFGYSEWTTESFTVKIFTQHFLSQIGSPGATDQASWQYDPVTDTGYYGFVEALELINGSDLASLVGYTDGFSHEPNGGWFKFYVGPTAACNMHDGGPYVMYFAASSFRADVSWTGMHGVGVAQGKEISIESRPYLIRLIGGIKPNTVLEDEKGYCADNLGNDSEWNMLFYRIHQDVPTCSNTSIGCTTPDFHGGPQYGENWANYTEDTVKLNDGIHQTGPIIWCYETNGTKSPRRGRYGIAGHHVYSSSDDHHLYGWRPVLVYLIGHS